MIESEFAEGRAIVTVSELNLRSRDLLEQALPGVWVEGEISNLAAPASGHWYFTLKDESAQIRWRDVPQPQRKAPTQTRKRPANSGPRRRKPLCRAWRLPADRRASRRCWRRSPAARVRSDSRPGCPAPVCSMSQSKRPYRPCHDISL